MKISPQRLCSRFIDTLGMATFACVALSLTLPGLIPAKVRAMVTLPTVSAQNTVDLANCLWYNARNQGFYSLQHAVATGTGTSANERLWLQLVEDIDPAVCASGHFDSNELIQALAETANEADRHFMASSQSWQTTLAYAH